MEGLIVVLFASGAMGMASGQAIGAARQLTATIYNLAGVSPDVLNRTIETASAVFTAAGVEMIWQPGDSDAEEAHTLDLGVHRSSAPQTNQEVGRRYIAVRITRGMSAGVPPHALGVSLPDARNGVNVTIFEDRAKDFCAFNGLDLGVVLGYVIAHEAGHVILGSPEHAPTGIMRARLGARDFEGAALSLLRFSAEQGMAIRDRACFACGLPVFKSQSSLSRR